MKTKFKLKINYFLIPLFVVFVSAFGSLFTSSNMAWYDSLSQPEITPPGSFIGLVWTVIFILSTIAALLFYNNPKPTRDFNLIVSLFIFNALLNILWSALFFGRGLMLLAFWEMIILNLTTAGLIIFLWRNNRISSLLLWPYFIWVSFATYLTYSFLLLN